MNNWHKQHCPEAWAIKPVPSQDKRVWAEGAPFEMKGKSYAWSDGVSPIKK